MQTLDEHFPLDGKTMYSRRFIQLLKVRQTVFAQAIKLGLGQKSLRLFGDADRTALAIGNIANFAHKNYLTPRTMLFLVFDPNLGLHSQ